jgi:YebC/PmpR family DNA-binding regulatory protein
MGRAFEKRKTTIFARADRMSKLFTRRRQGHRDRGEVGRPQPGREPDAAAGAGQRRAANMPKDKIEAAIKKASGQGAADYEIVNYEGYAPHGIAVLVECATDNVTRTVANVRMHFRANGGNFGATGSVAFLFQRMGVFRLAPIEGDTSELELALIDHGLQDMGEGTGDKGEPQLVIRSAFADFGTLAAGIEAQGLKVISSGSEYVAPTLVELPEDKAKEVLELVAALEDDDDVQAVYHNLG